MSATKFAPGEWAWTTDMALGLVIQQERGVVSLMLGPDTAITEHEAHTLGRANPTPKQLSVWFVGEEEYDAIGNE